MSSAETAAPATRHVSQSTAEEILDHKWVLRISAILGIITGIVAILMPLVATFAANLVIGAILAGQGVVDAVLAFKARSKKRMAGKFLLGLISIAAGVLLFLFPVFGVLSLTIWLAAYFAASGLMKGFWAFKLRPAPRWGWMLFSASIGVVIAALIVFGLPSTAFWVLGLFLGVDLIFFGFATLALIPRAKDMLEKNEPKASTVNHERDSDEASADVDQKSNAEVFIRQPAQTDPAAQTQS